MFGIPKTKILFIKFISKEEHITRIKKYCKSFLNFNYPNVNGGIRVKMGLGISEIDALIPINDYKQPQIKCVHLEYCGKYYFPHPKGFHKLSIKKICK